MYRLHLIKTSPLSGFNSFRNKMQVKEKQPVFLNERSKLLTITHNKLKLEAAADTISITEIILLKT